MMKELAAHCTVKPRKNRAGKGGGTPVSIQSRAYIVWRSQVEVNESPCRQIEVEIGAKEELRWCEQAIIMISW
jgi:hypothetical protein